MSETNALETALQRATINAGARAAFYQELLRSHVFVLARGHADQLPTLFNTELTAWIRDDGVRVTPFFSSQKAVRQALPHMVAPPSLVARIPARGLLEHSRGEHMHLNPYGEYGREFTPHEIDALLDHGAKPAPFSSQSIAAGTPIQLGRPTQSWPEFESALSAAFAAYPFVVEAYLYEMYVDVHGLWAQSLVVGVVGVHDDDVAHAICTVSADVYRGSIPIDVTFLKENDEIVMALRGVHVTPFYKGPRAGRSRPAHTTLQ